MQIASDPVGFGFVIRGEGPCYVKTVDPTGPAAGAGLKVCDISFSTVLPCYKVAHYTVVYNMKWLHVMAISQEAT